MIQKVVLNFNLSYAIGITFNGFIFVKFIKSMKSRKVQINILYTTDYGESFETKKIVMPSTNRVRDIFKFIQLKIDYFSNRKFILENEEGISSGSLSGIEALSELPFTKTLNLRVYPVEVCIHVISTEKEQTQKIDIRANISSLIKKIAKDHFERYVLAFQSEGSSKYNVLSQRLPLYTQDWFFENLVLIRRVYKEDIPFGTDNDFRHYLLKNCQFALARGLSFYTNEKWAELAALQFLINGKKDTSPEFIRKNISLYVSQNIKKDDFLVNKCSEYLWNYNTFTTEQAEIQYIIKSVNDGCQCAYIEKLRFSHFEGEKWSKLEERIVCISPYAIYVLAPDKSIDPNYIEDTNNLDISYKIDFIEVTFQDIRKWRLYSNNQNLLINILFSSFEKYEEPSIQPENSNDKQDEQEDLSEYLSFEKDNDKLTFKNQKRTQTNISTFDFDETSCEVYNKTVFTKKKNPRQKRKIPGIPKILIPGKFEINKEYDIIKDNIKEVHITKMIDSEDSESEKLLIDKEKFFEFTEEDSWEKNPISVLIILYIILQIIKFLYKYC